MFRLSKITDYGIALLALLAREPGAATLNARELALRAELPAPVVSKVLKLLARQGLLESQRGAKGGYCLARSPRELSVAEMITALEGPVGLTQCNVGPDLCEHEENCSVKGPWQVINDVVQGALHTVTLADLVDPGFPLQIAPLHVLGSAEPSGSPRDGQRV